MGIFDDVFRTMIERMPSLVIPVINEVFHTSYSENERIEQYRNEHQTKNGEKTTDSYLGIRDKLYHLECQSGEDSRMEIRMIEYDFAIALENQKQTGGMAEINFPNSCVLYLRAGNKSEMQKNLKVKVNFPDGRDIIYEVPTLRVQEYTKNEIFRKRLLMFLPYYIMRYENSLKEIENTPDRLDALAEEYEDIRESLQKELSAAEETEVYTRLIELTRKISDYVLQKSAKTMERIGGIMGGNVLELETDRILAKGIEQGLSKGIEQSACETAELMLLDGEPLEKIVRYAKLPVETISQIREKMIEDGKLQPEEQMKRHAKGR